LSDLGPRRRPTLWFVLVVGLLTLVTTLAALAVAGDDETINDIQVSLGEGVDPSWVPAGRLTEVNATVFGSHGTDLTNESEYHWEVSSDQISWMPRAPNVILIFPEWTTDVVINITATWNGSGVTTSVQLRTVRAVEDARLEMDPPNAPVCCWDSVRFTILLLDWRDEPILEGSEFNWSVTTGLLTSTEDAATMDWTLDQLGYQTIAVEYSQDQMRGSATFTVEVVRKLVSVEVMTMPSDMELGSVNLMAVTVQDHEHNDVTGETNVSVQVRKGSVGAIRWDWDRASGYLQIEAMRPGNMTLDLVADLAGSTVTTNYTLFINGTLDEPVLRSGNDLFDEWFETIMEGFMLILVILVIASVVSESRKIRNPREVEEEVVDWEDDDDLGEDEDIL
jgi:hypothetical protein